VRASHDCSDGNPLDARSGEQLGELVAISRTQLTINVGTPAGASIPLSTASPPPTSNGAIDAQNVPLLRRSNIAVPDLAHGLACAVGWAILRF
jgi:hypothetical protein